MVTAAAKLINLPILQNAFIMTLKTLHSLH